MGKIISYSLVAIAIVISGICIRSGLIAFKVLGSTVEVRGVAERKVLSNYGQWTPRFRIVGNNIKEIQEKHNNVKEILDKFLSEQGFSKEEIVYLPITMEDLESNPYSNERLRFRYTMTAPLVITTENVEKLSQAIKAVTTLYEQGINLIDNSHRYEFTQLNDIKPEMLKEAVDNARAAAEIFTNDTKTTLGKLKDASQGLFTITSEYGSYNAPSLYKRVRVVTRATYMLE